MKDVSHDQSLQKHVTKNGSVWLLMRHWYLHLSFLQSYSPVLVKLCLYIACRNFLQSLIPTRKSL